jgi:hypothetical protein
MKHVDIYGFGSYFYGSAIYNDIDIVIVHNDRTRESCRLAITCKRELQSNRSNLHITMLSKQAERSFGFLATAHANHIGHIEGDATAEGINKILHKIHGNSLQQIFTHDDRTPAHKSENEV